MIDRYYELERQYASEIADGGVKAMQYGLAVMYIWFGFAKVFAPGDGLPIVNQLFAMAGFPSWMVVALAVWEVGIGVLFLRDEWIRWGAIMASFHLLGTFAPLFMLRELTFSAPLWLTLQGQFVLKNVALHGGAWLLWAVAIERDPRTPNSGNTAQRQRERPERTTVRSSRVRRRRRGR